MQIKIIQTMVMIFMLTVVSSSICTANDFLPDWKKNINDILDKNCEEIADYYDPHVYYEIKCSQNINGLNYDVAYGFKDGQWVSVSYHLVDILDSDMRKFTRNLASQIVADLENATWAKKEYFSTENNWRYQQLIKNEKYYIGYKALGNLSENSVNLLIIIDNIKLGKNETYEADFEKLWLDTTSERSE